MKITVTEIDISAAQNAITNSHHLPGFIWLDSSDHAQVQNRWSIIGIDPLKPLTTWDKWQSITQMLTPLTPKLPTKNLPFHTGLLGFLSYEAASNWMPSALFKSNSQFPKIYGGLYHQVILIDHQNSQAHYIQTQYPNERAPLPLDQLITCRGGAPYSNSVSLHPNKIMMNSKETYLQKILTVKDHIQEGDIYQLNLSHQMTSALPMPPFELYLKLRTGCPVPYAAYINTGAHHILSASPESLFKTDDTTITTRPIKGTIERGPTQEQDNANKHHLQSSSKDQAELMMITDLERNDLGKLCHFGSVQVPQLKTLETYPNVHHLVSTIKGDLLPNLTLTDILQALFPGGSITGAPKQKSMEIINQLEPTPRNIYTGSIGYYDITKKSEFNIAIRTMYTLGGAIHFHSGGGITADSNPDHEWEETLTKASSIITSITL